MCVYINFVYCPRICLEIELFYKHDVAGYCMAMMAVGGESSSWLIMTTHSCV